MKKELVESGLKLVKDLFQSIIWSCGSHTVKHKDVAFRKVLQPLANRQINGDSLLMVI